MSRARLQELFRKIGSEKRLLEIMTDFYERQAKDVLIGFFFDGKDLAEIASKQCEFLLHAMGILSPYTGKTPAFAHLTLPPILPGHYDRRQVILRQTLLSHGLSEREIQIWMDFENAFRPVIVKERS